MEKIVNSFNKSIFESDNSIKVNCPTCGSTEVLFHSEVVLKESSNYTAWKGQGNSLKIIMTCLKEGHTWHLCLGMHKNHTFVYLGEVNDHYHKETA